MNNFKQNNWKHELEKVKSGSEKNKKPNIDCSSLSWYFNSHIRNLEDLYDNLDKIKDFSLQERVSLLKAALKFNCYAAFILINTTGYYKVFSPVLDKEGHQFIANGFFEAKSNLTQEDISALLMIDKKHYNKTKEHFEFYHWLKYQSQPNANKSYVSMV